MDRRVELQNILEDLLGSGNVYYQPPESVRISYPAIIYFLSSINRPKANDKDYLRNPSYDVTIIDKNPESEYVEKMLDTFEYIRYDRHYDSDNLHHFVFKLYY